MLLRHCERQRHLERRGSSKSTKTPTLKPRLHAPDQHARLAYWIIYRWVRFSPFLCHTPNPPLYHPLSYPEINIHLTSSSASAVLRSWTRISRTRLETMGGRCFVLSVMMPALHIVSAESVSSLPERTGPAILASYAQAGCRPRWWSIEPDAYPSIALSLVLSVCHSRSSRSLVVLQGVAWSVLHIIASHFVLLFPTFHMHMHILPSFSFPPFITVLTPHLKSGKLEKTTVSIQR
ncbi:hypothetical protein C8J57DRAFT_1510851 [Mycena rebaudengoi]|nr:hypothetical protein C8J57DRAFT_1510851 [Mycena rebaudengoi]